MGKEIAFALMAAASVHLTTVPPEKEVIFFSKLKIFPNMLFFTG
jgi:hypothetical protein